MDLQLEVRLQLFVVEENSCDLISSLIAQNENNSTLKIYSIQYIIHYVYTIGGGKEEGEPPRPAPTFSGFHIAGPHTFIQN